jgi:Family of unknown function (DUF6188)
LIMPSDSQLFGGKELTAIGEEVSAITLDSNVVIFLGPRREHEFRIENDILVDNASNGSNYVVKYDPYNRSDPVRQGLTELSSIVATRVVHAKAYVDGILEITLNDGTVLTVHPKEKYEAWTYTFGNYILACPPGGFHIQ